MNKSRSAEAVSGVDRVPPVALHRLGAAVYARASRLMRSGGIGVGSLSAEGRDGWGMCSVSNVFLILRYKLLAQDE